MRFIRRQAAPESMLLITIALYELAERFLGNIFEIGADQEIAALTADMR